MIYVKIKCGFFHYIYKYISGAGDLKTREVVSQLMRNPQVLAAMQSRLDVIAGTPSGYIERYIIGLSYCDTVQLMFFYYIFVHVNEYSNYMLDIFMICFGQILKLFAYIYTCQSSDSQVSLW